MALIFGLDPGSTCAAPTGFALVDTDADTVCAYGLLKPQGAEHIAALALQCYELLSNLVCAAPDQTPALVAIEAPFTGAFPKAGLTLARLVGAYTAVAALCALPVVEVTPAAAKATLTGNGKATKAQMIDMIRLRYGLAVSEHVADAIAVALAAVGEWRATA